MTTEFDPGYVEATEARRAQIERECPEIAKVGCLLEPLLARPSGRPIDIEALHADIQKIMERFPIIWAALGPD